MEELTKIFEPKFNGIYGWTTNGHEAVPPIHDFPIEVKERVDYFADLTDDGLTFLGILDCIFSEEKTEGYDFGASKPWLPMTEGFKEWVNCLHSLAQMEVAVYLLYGHSESVEVE
ncbi:hypothetical protein [Streptococcus danieliae]|uniref:hypothetical protein n=1 Tax=Streptococcus danieliae TaxID=747656 RepID=UPI0021C64BFE|nr:hypothetical protein [Streptococcus danieliae]MCU0082463.1 hypothetical protein [Streptococcus danieliae]